MLRSLLVLVSLIFIYAASASAETYTWVDSKGTVNFADDLSQVPKKYRKKVRTRGDVGPGMQESVESKEETPAAKDKGATAGSNEKGTSGKSDKTAKSDKKDAVYGGKSGASWKQEFTTLRSQIESVDDQLADAKARQQNSEGKSRSEYLGNQYTIKSLQEKRNDLQGKLDALNEAASRAGVPSEFR